MSNNRHELHNPNSIAGISHAVTAREVLPWHKHAWAQLVYAREGVMQVNTSTGTWLVPTTRTIWIPPEHAHSIEMRSSVVMATLYVGEVSGEWPKKCCALEVSPLFRELILHIVNIGELDPDEPSHQRLMGMTADLLGTDEIEFLRLQMPKDHRALQVVNVLVSRPTITGTLTELVKDSGASLRTIQRIFRAETGLSLDAWRQRICMQHALVLLHEHPNVTEIALEIGYATTSAFVHAFRGLFGAPPLSYISR
jgi:AraC-like DNA-binding protein